MCDKGGERSVNKEKMLAVVKEKAGRGWELREKPKPTISDTDVLIRVRMIGICGSDMGIYEGKRESIRIPVVPGHEFAGEVVETGSAVTEIQPHSSVAVNLEVFKDSRKFHDNFQFMGFFLYLQIIISFL